jgi:hypothetical protein
MRMSRADITTIEVHNCFACEYINSNTLRENNVFFKMIKLYTDNAANICKPAIYRMIKTYFDQHVKNNVNNYEWSLQSIEQHFTTHTMYPTDEILTQLSITTGLRNHIANNLGMRKSPDDTEVQFQDTNIKHLLNLNKELRILRTLRNDIPNMVGYDEVLHF